MSLFLFIEHLLFTTIAVYYYLEYHVLTSGRYLWLLDKEGKPKRDRWYPRLAIIPFRYIFHSGNDQVLVNATGFDHTNIHILLSKLKPYYDYYTFNEETGLIRAKKLCSDGTPYGRLFDMCAMGCMGLILM